jgi:hypothetical protein
LRIEPCPWKLSFAIFHSIDQLLLIGLRFILKIDLSLFLKGFLRFLNAFFANSKVKIHLTIQVRENECGDETQGQISDLARMRLTSAMA